jgi:predicted ABC-type ATPase
MFAGPNGSGKSLLKSLPQLGPALLGVYVNPDEIEARLKKDAFLELASFQIQAQEVELKSFLSSHALIQRQQLVGAVAQCSLADGLLRLSPSYTSAYWAAAIAAFIRKKLLEAGVSFTTETVMSSRDKVELLIQARLLGYRTYLYFIATEDPEINLSRIEARVAAGGHTVPRDKVISRYERSLDLLLEAIFQSDRAYIFDNSNDRGEKLWVAEVTDGNDLDLKVNPVPAWFQKAVLDKAIDQD